MTSAALVIIVEEAMSMSIVVVVVDTHAIVVIARDDVDSRALGWSSFGCQNQSVPEVRWDALLG